MSKYIKWTTNHLELGYLNLLKKHFQNIGFTVTTRDYLVDNNKKYGKLYILKDDFYLNNEYRLTQDLPSGEELVKEEKTENKVAKIDSYKIQLIKEKSGKYNCPSKVRSPRDIADILNTVCKLDMQSEEVLMLITLDTKNNVTGTFEVSRGSISSSIVHPREVFKRALLMNATSIIIGHNHPTGDTTPSKQDIDVTKRIAEGGKLLGIELLDHIIVGDNYTSLKEEGYL